MSHFNSVDALYLWVWLIKLEQCNFIGEKLHNNIRIVI
jgi:hypothetical protein